MLLCLPEVKFLNKKDHSDGLHVPADLVVLLLSALLWSCSLLPVCYVEPLNRALPQPLSHPLRSAWQVQIRHCTVWGREPGRTSYSPRVEILSS